jgi:hypothetical protein
MRVGVHGAGIGASCLYSRGLMIASTSQQPKITSDRVLKGNTVNFEKDTQKQKHRIEADARSIAYSK